MTPPVSLTHKKEVQSTEGAFWKIWCSFFSCREEEDVAGKRTGRSYDLHRSSPRKSGLCDRKSTFFSTDDFKPSFKFVFRIIFIFFSQSEICSRACQFDLPAISLLTAPPAGRRGSQRLKKPAQEPMDAVRNEKRLPAFLLLPSSQ